MTVPQEPATVLDQPTVVGSRSDPDQRQGERHSGALSQVKAEEPRRHPIAYVALALAVIALLWLAVMSAGGDEFQRVQVGNRDCVSVPQDTGPAALYCRTDAAGK